MRANPPLHRRIPAGLLKDKDSADFYEGFLFDMFLLWQRSGGGDDFINDALLSTQINTTSHVMDLRLLVDVTPVTIDTTGFTVDLTKQTTDKTKV